MRDQPWIVSEENWPRLHRGKMEHARPICPGTFLAAAPRLIAAQFQKHRETEAKTLALCGVRYSADNHYLGDPLKLELAS